ncbi:hypothetical protein [Oceanobacter mangrovi]|uniref:hypothetical protein n=1 Tax=Oceanobacter mangrovi TaxID=2862510 RepID=UPI001C8D26A0|nr:hypothetical protein [Oceanobacter mangrovi]
MTPSEQCKAAGLTGLAELVRTTGESKQTLINWHRNKPQLFKIVVSGALMHRIREATQSIIEANGG